MYLKKFHWVFAEMDVLFCGVSSKFLVYLIVDYHEIVEVLQSSIESGLNIFDYRLST